MMGLYQVGYQGLYATGYVSDPKTGGWTEKAHAIGVYSDDDFLSNPLAQNTVLPDYLRENWGYIKSDNLDKYVGKTIDGVYITEAGLVIASQFGHGNLKSALQNENFSDFKDANGTLASDYMREVGDLDVSIITKN